MIKLNQDELRLIKQELAKLQKYNPSLFTTLQNMDRIDLTWDNFCIIFKELMIYFEGYKKSVYDDATGLAPKIKGKFKGCPTIGIGCNLKIYGKFLPEILNKKKEIIEEIYLGKYILSDLEVHALFMFCVQEHAQNLYLRFNSIYFDLWGDLSPSLQLIISCLYFNSGNALIGRNSELYALLHNGKPTIEIIAHLFKIAKNQKYQGLKIRRYIEGIILWLNLAK